MANAVAAALAAVAAEPGGIEVMGDSATARALRELLSERLVPAGARPRIVIEASGDPRSIQQALGRVEDLGLVLLAETPAAPGPLDVYSDLHLRGLTLVGVPRAQPGRSEE